MWQIEQQEVEAGKTFLYKLKEGEALLSGLQVFTYLKESEAFRDFLANALSASPFEAYYWEVRPYRTETLHEPFEYVLLQSLSLPKKQAEISDFEEHFRQNMGLGAVAFPNLSKKSMLIAPTPLKEHRCYTHLAVFVRTAPPEQVGQWLQLGSIEYLKALESGEAKWLSTAGLGVYWLHLRIDPFPKYYKYRPYK